MILTPEQKCQAALDHFGYLVITTMRPQKIGDIIPAGELFTQDGEPIEGVCRVIAESNYMELCDQFDFMGTPGIVVHGFFYYRVIAE